MTAVPPGPAVGSAHPFMGDGRGRRPVGCAVGAPAQDTLTKVGGVRCSARGLWQGVPAWVAANSSNTPPSLKVALATCCKRRTSTSRPPHGTAPRCRFRFCSVLQRVCCGAEPALTWAAPPEHSLGTPLKHVLHARFLRLCCPTLCPCWLPRPSLPFFWVWLFCSGFPTFPAASVASR